MSSGAPDQPIAIGRAGAERLAALEPLWAQMQAHHEAVAPGAVTNEVVAFRDAAGSWARRRALYASWFATDSAVLHVATTAAQDVVGYAMVRLSDASWSQLAIPAPMAELESFSVAAAQRGHGIGTRLLAAVHADLRERGVAVIGLAGFAGNEAAERLYARHGMRPVLTQMLGRVPPAPA